MYGSVPLPAESPTPPPPGASEARAPFGPMGTGPSSRGDNSAFVSFVWMPEWGWALLLYKGIFWWGLVSFYLLSSWGWR